MFTGLHCGDKFPEGITNGAWWYPVLGMYAKKMAFYVVIYRYQYTVVPCLIRPLPPKASALMRPDFRYTESKIQ
jgi:hypothetical protein